MNTQYAHTHAANFACRAPQWSSLYLRARCSCTDVTCMAGQQLHRRGLEHKRQRLRRQRLRGLQHRQQRLRGLAQTTPLLAIMASEDSGEEWEGVHEVFAANNSEDIMLDDILPGTKTTTPAPDVSQQIEAHLDKLDKYTNDQLHEIVHACVYLSPTHGHSVDRVRRHDSR